jgi:mono/diheme cytochrome c family protein
MMDQRNLKSQDYDEALKTPGNRMPPAGTVPRGFQPYVYETDPLGAEAKLANPLAGQMTEEVLAMGRKRYDVYCAVCHGPQGAGDGTVAQYMALKPPPLTSDKVKNFKDGRIFHIITAGQGVMGNYATQIHNVEDRWAIVNYIRSLQKAN